MLGICSIEHLLQIAYPIPIRVAGAAFAEAAKQKPFEIVQQQVAVTVVRTDRRHTLESQADHFNRFPAATVAADVRITVNRYLTPRRKMETFQEPIRFTKTVDQSPASIAARQVKGRTMPG